MGTGVEWGWVLGGSYWWRHWGWFEFGQEGGALALVFAVVDVAFEVEFSGGDFAGLAGIPCRGAAKFIAGQYTIFGKKSVARQSLKNRDCFFGFCSSASIDLPFTNESRKQVSLF